MFDMFNVYLPIAELHFNILILIAIGFSVGVLGGFFGVGGAWVVTPALNIFGFPMAYAIGTDLAHIFGKSIVATAKHRKMGNVDVKLGLISIVGSVIGLEIGAQNVMWLTRIGLAGPVVRYTYMFLLFGLGIYMLYDFATKDKRAAAQAAKMAAATRSGITVEPKKGWNLPPMMDLPTSGITISLDRHRGLPLHRLALRLPGGGWRLHPHAGPHLSYRLSHGRRGGHRPVLGVIRRGLRLFHLWGQGRGGCHRRGLHADRRLHRGPDRGHRG